MSSPKAHDYAHLYSIFPSPITRLDCGYKCAPFNQNGVPFCCDINHAVPTAYLAEWEYLSMNSNLWRRWEGDHTFGRKKLSDQVPSGQVLIACRGDEFCQRNYRSLTCRAFPFFPYISQNREFLGLSYYIDYEDRCWIISNLDRVTPEYIAEFSSAYDYLFDLEPQEVENFRYHSKVMRRIYGRRHRAIPLLHRNGFFYQVTPKTDALRRGKISRLPKYGPYQITDLLPFPGEDEDRE